MTAADVDWAPGDPIYSPPPAEPEPEPDTVRDFDISRNPMFWAPNNRPDGDWSWLQGGAAA